ncbi:hypothetical protein DRO97_03330 [Archaeoglobales archaeon]|nr:MAG: hypothetical protein DRO97_03330 [Archaeoglobales archaeon]
MIVFQWHGDTFDLPENSMLLFEGKEVKNQEFRIGKVIGLQFHLEVKKETVEKWINAEKTLSKEEKEKIINQTEKYIEELHKNCRIMVDSFLNL